MGGGWSLAQRTDRIDLIRKKHQALVELKEQEAKARALEDSLDGYGLSNNGRPASGGRNLSGEIIGSGTWLPYREMVRLEGRSIRGRAY